MMTRLLIVAVATLTAATAVNRLEAHRTAVSPFTFHRDVLPIIEAKCAGCHADGRVAAPLLRYADARMVTWPMRQLLSRGHTPPWFAEGQPAFKSPPLLTAAELNILMTWATGGGPEGTPLPSHPSSRVEEWPLGHPDLVLTMPAAFTFAANQRHRIHEVALPSNALRGRMIRMVDLRPGTPGIVRRAEIVARTGAGEQVLALWQPGDEPAQLEANAAFRIDRHAIVVLKIHYRRTGLDDVADRSRVGVYFARGRAAAVESMELATDRDRPVTQRIDRPMRAVAIRPISGPAGSTIQLTVVHGDGSRTPLARLEMQPDWDRRYAFSSAVIVKAGEWIETKFQPSQNGLWSSLTGDVVGHPDDSTCRVMLEFVR